jgi:hypothetical protein
MESIPPHLVAQSSKGPSTREDLPIGTLVMQRGLDGVEVRVPLQEGDVISFSGTEVRSIWTGENGTEKSVYQDSIDPNYPIIITWSSSAPLGDTIRVRTKQGMTKWGFCASRYPHPRTVYWLQPEENVTYYDKKNSRTSIFPDPDSRLQLVPAKASLKDKDGISLGEWIVGTGDTVSALVGEDSREFVFTMNTEGTVSSEIADY